jgi:predicted transglutaminase-like cysteine proteinase
MMVAAAIFAAPARADVPVPTGFKVMCVMHPGECRGGGASKVTLTDDVMALLERVNAEVNASALSYVYALRNGGGHAILAVHTSGGSFALDNMSARVKPLNRTGYRIVSLSGPNPTVWRKL